MPTRSFLSRRYGVLCALLLVSACSGARQEAPQQRASSADVNAFLRSVLEAGPAFAYDDLIEQLGPPVREEAASTDARRGPSRPDTLRTLVYYGLELALQERTASRTSRLAHFALTDARYTSPEGVRVGYAESQVLTTLGLPTRRESTQLIYAKETPQPCVLVIFLERRTVSRMEWRFTME